MAAISPLSRFGRLASRMSMYQSIKEVGGAARATMDAGYFKVPFNTIKDAQRPTPDDGKGPQLVFSGCPGVGKGTYASRLAKFLAVPHIAMGDIIRQELKSSSLVSKHLSATMLQGKLLPDEVICNLLAKRLQSGMPDGERGFILDGFPRTICQAKILEDILDIDLVVNLKLREDILTIRCLGRRICSNCGKAFNLAKVDVKGAIDGEPRIVIPPHLPPLGCAHKMTIRADDSYEVVKARLCVYNEESTAVEAFYRAKGKILDFNVCGSIPETWLKLLAALNLQDKKKTISN